MKAVHERASDATQREPPDPGFLLDVVRRALADVTDGLDGSVVDAETPLAALLFDSLTAVKFIATLEASLGTDELPFERWLAEHSERTDALTVGSLVDWLRSLPQLGPDAAAGGAAARPGDR